MARPAAAATNRAQAASRRGAGSRIPRRVSGPARGESRARTTRAFELVHGLAQGRMLDRLLRSRAGIALVGVLLSGVVFTQVSLLKLNAGIGRAVESTATLQRENAALESSVSRLSSSDRIQAAGERMGLMMPAASQLRFVRIRPGRDARRAARLLRPPRPQPPPPAPPVVKVQPQPAPTPAPAPAPAASTPAPGTTTAPGGSGPPSGTPAPSPAPAPTPAPAAGGTAAPVPSATTQR